MGVADKVTPEIVGWGVLMMLVVVLSLVLLNFKTSGIACSGTSKYNATNDLCCATSGAAQNCSVNNTPTVFATIDTSVTAFQEPANWIQIVIISLIGVAIIGLFFLLFKMRR